MQHPPRAKEGSRGVHRIIKLKQDDYGIYARRYRNPTTGTPLIFRGTEQEVDEFLDQQQKALLKRRLVTKQRLGKEGG